MAGGYSGTPATTQFLSRIPLPAISILGWTLTTGDDPCPHRASALLTGLVSLALSTPEGFMVEAPFLHT